VNGGSHANINALAGADPEGYYDKMAPEYEETVRKWGYDMPERVADMLLKHASSGSLHILDCGCGDGLVGAAVMKAEREGLLLEGVDLSGEMLTIAEKRGAYASLRKADLSRPLPYEDDSFDALLCVGVLY